MKIADAVFTTNLESTVRSIMHSTHDSQTALGQTQRPGDKGQTDRQQSKEGDRHLGAGTSTMVTGITHESYNKY
jgi:hypothetical protein